MKVLVVVDMQNDFIDGALANPLAQTIVKDVALYVSGFEGLIVFTQDTHGDDYLGTREGRKLPVVHCVFKTDGWNINDEILIAAKNNKKARVLTVSKSTFAAGANLYKAIRSVCENPEEIEFCGTCTDICVVSNVLTAIGNFTESEITVRKDLCAGLTKEKHEAALEVMRSCQVKVI